MGVAKTLAASAMGLLITAMAAGADAEEAGAVAALRSEAVRLHAELVLLRRIRSAQRALIEWTRISDEGQVRGLPVEICEASPLQGLCPRLRLTFSKREETT